MLIQRLDLSGDPTADGDDVRALNDAFAGAERSDTPGRPTRSLRDARTKWAYGMTGEPTETWVARSDEDSPVVGGYNLAFPTADNTHLALVHLAVGPEERRQGYGGGLLDHAAGRVRAAGRHLLVGETTRSVSGESSPGEAFAAAVGAARGLEEPTRVLDLDEVDTAAHAELLQEARERSVGYTPLYWTGPAPEEHLDGVVALMTRMADAPTEDLDLEDEVWDRGRVRAAERGIELRGRRSYTVAARHDASADLAARSTVTVPPEPSGWGFQGDTVVLPEHRGRRLGLLVKLSMLAWLAEREPAVRKLLTGNAASNTHMIRINELMGYRLLHHCTEWQLPV